MMSGEKHAHALLRPSFLCAWLFVFASHALMWADSSLPQYPSDSPLAYSEWKEQATALSAQATRTDRTVSNDYVKLEINDDGRFGIRTTGGSDLDDSSDDNKTLVYGSYGSTSTVGVRIDGQTYALSSQSKLSSLTLIEDDTVGTITWSVEDVLIVGRYELADSGYGRADTAKLTFTFTNESVARATKVLSFKIGIDTMIGWNDGASIATSAGIIDVETGFGMDGLGGEYAEPVPDFWQALEEDDIASPGVVAQGTFVGGGSTKPDKFVTGEWSEVSGSGSNLQFDYQPDGGAYNWDSAVGLWWLDRSLGPGETLTIVTYYGLGELTGVSGALALSVAAPSVLSEVNNVFDPNPFTVNAQVQNNTGSSLTDVNVTMTLPSGLSVTSRATDTQVISQLGNGAVDLVSWQVYAESAYSGQTLSYTVQASGGGYTSDVVTRDITLPELAIVTEILLEYPNGGEELEEGTVHTILWRTGEEITSVDLAYSDDHGQTWRAIASSLANTGSYDWEVPAPTAGVSARSDDASTSDRAGSPSDDAVGRENLFADGFEGGGADWTISSASGAAGWQVTDHPESVRVETPAISPDLVALPDQGYLPSARSGTKCAWFGSSADSTGTYMGTYDDAVQQLGNGGRSTEAQKGSLDTPAIDLTTVARNGATGVWLDFWAWWEIEAGDVGPGRYDQMRVLVSSDGGTTFTLLGMLNPLTDLNIESSHAYSSGGLGETGEWVPVCFDLSDYVGQEVTVRFQFDTVDRYANGFRGWLIDDVALSDEAPALSLSSVEPDVGTANGIVEVTGSGMVYGAAVSVGSTVATSAVLSQEHAQIAIPELSPGVYDVTVQNPDGSTVTLPQALTVSADTPPEVLAVSPDSGANTIATAVTVTGTGFVAGASVTVAGAPLTSVAVQSASSLTGVIPTGLSSGFQNVAVLNPSGLRDTLVGGFEVTGPPYYVRVSDSTNTNLADQSDEGFTIVGQSCPLPVEPSTPSPSDSATSVRLGTSLSWVDGGVSSRETSCDFDDLTPGDAITACGEVTFEISGLTSPPVVYTADSAVTGVTSSSANVAGASSAGALIGGVFNPGTDTEFNYVSMYFGNDSGFTGDVVLTAYRDESASVLAKSVTVAANGDDYCNQLVELYTPVGGKSWTLSFAGSMLPPCIDDLRIGQGLCPTRYDVYLGTTDPPPLVVSGITDTAWEPSRLDAGTVYYWQVASVSCCGETPGPVWSFTTSGDLVTVESIDASQFPTVSATVAVATAIGSSCGLSSGNFAVTENGVSQSLTSVNCVQTRDASYTLSYTSLDTTEDGSQRLLVVVVTDPDEGTLDASENYTVPCPLPASPISPSPGTGATSVAADTSFSWDGGTVLSACPVTWDVYLYTDASAPPQSPTAEDLASAVWSPTGLLADQQAYYWKIVAKNSRGESSSAVWSFTTGSRSLAVTYPNGSEEFIEGTTETVTWTWDGAVETVGLEYYDGSTWQTITEATPNTGSYDWVVPVPAGASRSSTGDASQVIDSDAYEPDLADQTRLAHHASVERESYEWHVTEHSDLDVHRCFDYKWLHIPVVTDATPPVDTSFTLAVSGWDVDSDDTTQADGPEHDRVYMNGYYLGELTGANRAWSVTTFEVPYDVLVFPGENTVDIEIDTVNTHYWCLEVDWVTLTSTDSGGVGLEFTGFDDYGVDDDADGLFDWLCTELSVQVPPGSNLAGTYRLEAVLRSSGRSTDIVQATAEQVLSEGDNSMSLSFEGEAISEYGIDGPYLVANVMIYNTSDPATYQWTSGDFVTTGSRPGSGADHYLAADFDPGFLVSPQVQSTIPADGALNVALDSTVQITFNTDLDQSTVSSTNIRVQSSSRANTDVSGAWSYADRVAVFTPDSSLLAFTLYDVTVGTGVEASNGQPLPSVHAFSFTTGEQQLSEFPYLVRVFIPSASSIADESDSGFGILEQLCSLPNSASNPEPAHEATDQSVGVVLRWNGNSAARSTVCDFDTLVVGTPVDGAYTGLTFGVSGVTATVTVLSAVGATGGVTTSGANVAGATGGGQAVGGVFEASQNYIAMYFGNDAGFTGTVRLTAFRDEQATSVAKVAEASANGNDACDQLIELYSSVPVRSWTLEFVDAAYVSPCVDDVTFGTELCPTRYDVYLGQSDPPSSCVAQGVTDLEYDPGSLALGTRYYWSVVAWNCCSDGDTASSADVWSFETSDVCPAPDPPSNPTPADGVAGISVYTTLSWASGSQIPGCTTTWDVYLDTSTEPTTLIASDLSSPVCDAGVLQDGTVYYWKAVAKTSGDSTSGPVWSFTTSQRSITVLYPNGGETFVEGTTETLTWTWNGPVTDVTLEYSGSAGLEGTWTTIVSSTANTGSFDWQVPAPSVRDAAAPSYILRVADATDSAISDVSDAGFDILAQTCPLPSSVQYDSPQNDADVSGAVTLQWSSATARRSSVCDFDDLSVGQTLGSPCSDFTFGLTGITGQAKVFSAASAVGGITSSGGNVVGTASGGSLLGGYFGSDQSDVAVNYIAMTVGNDAGYTGSVRLSAYMNRDGTGLAKQVSLAANGNDACDQTIELYSSIAVRSWALEFVDSVTVSPCIDDLTYGTEVCPTVFDVYFGSTNPPVLVASSPSSTTYDTGALDELTTYYWQIVARNCCGQAAGGVWSFDTVGSPDFVTLTQVSHETASTFPFPVLTATVQVNTQAGLGCELTVDDFGLTDNGVSQTLEWVNCRYGGGAADIVVAFDDTGAMGHDIWSLKDAVTAFAEDVATRSVDSQFGLISFKDTAEIDLALTASVDSFNDAVDALTASGGGDYGEAALDAVMLGLAQMNFRADAQPVFIVVTGAPAHYDGDGSGVSSYSMMTVIRSVNAAGGTVFAVSSDLSSRADAESLSPSAPRSGLAPVSDVAGDVRILSDGTGGQWQDLSTVDFSQITSAIESYVAATSYSLVYQTTNDLENGAVHDVIVTANDPVRGPDDDAGTYTAPDASRFDAVPWECTLQVTGIRSEALSFGMAEGGQDAVVPGEDEALSSESADGAVVAFFTCDGQRRVRDIRGLSEEAEWELTVEGGESEVQLSWSLSGTLAEGRYIGLYEVDELGEPVGGTGLWLGATDSLALSPGESHHFVIRHASDVVFDLPLSIGWNLVSLPVVPVDNSVESVFAGTAARAAEEASMGDSPSTAGLVWRYESGQYVSVSEVSALEGYWVYSTASATVVLRGIPVSSSSVSLSTGWNLIGVPVHCSALSGGDVQSSWYYWDADSGRYGTAVELVPGLGYWVQTGRGCVLELSP